MIINFRHIRMAVLFFSLLFLQNNQGLYGEVPNAHSHYSHSKNLKIYFQDYGKKNAPAIVFIHGWSCDHTFWRFQVAELSKEYRLIIVDLPGYGLSGKLGKAIYSPDIFAESINSVLETAGINRAILVGHSSGFVTARQFAFKYPNKARALCIVDGVYFRIPKDPQAFADWKTETDAFVQGFRGPNRKEYVQEFINSTFYGKTPQPFQDEILTKVMAADEHVANSAMEELSRPELWKEAAITIPTLAVYAKTAELPSDNETYLRTLFPSLAYKELDDTGHFIMMEQPEKFNTLLLGFMNNLKE
jgi:pimeloyl-ACP methyl ester carboxylesterase